MTTRLIEVCVLMRYDAMCNTLYALNENCFEMPLNNIERAYGVVSYVFTRSHPRASRFFDVLF